MIMPLRGTRPARTVISALAAAALLSIVAACAGGSLTTDYERAHRRIDAYLAAHPKTGPATAAAIRHAEVRTGMTPQQVIAAWGRPVSVQNYRGGARQFWMFGCNWPHHCDYPDSRRAMAAEIYLSQVLFENGRVIEHTN